MMKHPGRRIRNSAQAGFTLIETICAAAILSLAIAGLTNLTATSAALRQTGMQKDAAMRAAERQIATIIASDFATIPATWDNFAFTVGIEGKVGNALHAPPGDADNLPGIVRITAPTGDASQLVDIFVTIDWVSPHGPSTLTRRMRLSRLGSGS